MRALALIRRRWRLSVAMTALLVVGLVAGGIAYTSWVRTGDREYAAAEAVHGAGDCVAAAEQYRTMAERVESIRRGLARKAEARAIECDSFAAAEAALGAARAAEGEWDDAVDAFEEYRLDHPAGLLIELSKERSAALKEEWGAADLMAADEAAVAATAQGTLESFLTALDAYSAVAADHAATAAAAGVAPGLIGLADSAVGLSASGRHCEAIPVLDAITSRGDPIFAEAVTRSTAQTPRALYECGVAKWAAGDATGTIDLLDRLGREFPADPLVVQAQAPLDAARAAAEAEAIAAEIAAAQCSADELPPPNAVGSSESGTVTVTITNDSPDQLEMLFSGPSVDRVGVEACSDCVKYYLVAPLTACNKGSEPSVTLELAPGTYSVLVKSKSDSGVTPFVGTWELTPGTEYSNCFYITEFFG